MLPTSVHSMLGTIAIALVIVQAISGQQKMYHLEHNNKRVRRWHGDSGLMSWDLICFAVFSGLIAFLPVSLLSIAT